MKTLIIKKNKKGLGIYAIKSFKCGEKIYVLAGKIQTPKTLHYHGDNFKRGIIDPLQVGPDKYMELDKISILFNHSCQPNAGIKGRSVLFALKNIKKGEEITYDYSTTIDESFWCKCGSKKCRGVIYDFFTLSPIVQRRYFKFGALPGFLKVKYAKLISKKCPCGSGKKYKSCHGK